MTFNFSYELKLKMTLIGGVIIIALCYQFAISKTIQEYKNYNSQIQTRSSISNPVTDLQQLNYKSAGIEQIFDQFALDTLNPSKNLLGIASNYCNNHHLQFKEYRPVGITPLESLNILTRNIVVEGSFIDCLGLIYELETQKRTGRVSSALFKSYTDTKNKKVRLSCIIFIQNVIPLHEKI